MTLQEIKAIVVMLPTNKQSKLRIDDGELVLSDSKLCKNTINYQYQNLYVISNDTIKLGDWVYNKNEYPKIEYIDGSALPNISDYKKIVATTDENLNLPKIPNNFIEKYCEAGGINEISIEYLDTENFCIGNCGICDGSCDDFQIPNLIDNTIIIK